MSVHLAFLDRLLSLSLPALLIVAVAAAPVPVKAQGGDDTTGGEAPAPNQIEILHTPPNGENLPFPGKLMPLTISLGKTKDMSLKVRAFIIADGRLMEVPLASNAVNLADRPEYKAEIHAPLARLQYQFLVYKPDGEPVLSKQYLVERPCVPHLTFPGEESLTGLDPSGEPTQPDVKKRLVSYIERCTILERERFQYDIAFKLLDQIKANLEERDKENSAHAEPE